MGLDTIHLRALLIAYPPLHQGYLDKQGRHHRRRRRSRLPFVAGQLLSMRAQVAAARPLDHGIHQSADHREHRQGGTPFGFLQPYRAKRCGVLAPAQAGFPRRVLRLIGLEPLRIRPDRRAHDGQP